MMLNDITDLDNAPFTLDGQGNSAVKIHFESEQNRADYLAMERHGASYLCGLKDIFDVMAAIRLPLLSIESGTQW